MAVAHKVADRNRSVTPLALSTQMMYTIGMNTKLCKLCGETKDIFLFSLDGNRKDGHDHMCKECRKKNYRASRVKVECEGCGKETLKRSDRVSKLCWLCATRKSNMLRSGVYSPTWNGGETVSTKGYKMVLKKGHPRAARSGYVAEHILVMEDILGRVVAKHETVHHKNGIKRDNSKGNLELWAKPHPAGQRVLDLVNWVIENYKEELVKKLLGPMVK